VCYSEYVISNWISVAPLAADPFIGLAAIFIPATPDICPFGQKEVIQWIFEFM
jgi:hypothetical protein